jgi:hypothetical protein
MTFTSTAPLTLNGVRLDTLAYSIETVGGRRMLPKQRVTMVQIPGRDGAAVDFDDAFEEGRLILKMWIVDADVNGNVPFNQRAQFEANLDAIFSLLATTRGRTITVQQTMADGSIRQTNAIITEEMTPDIFGPNAARMNIGLTLPDVWWEDVSSSDFSFTDALTPSFTNITTLAGASAPIDDGRYLVTGPVTNPRVIDVASGQWAQLTRTLAAGNMWLFDAKTRVSRYGAGLTLNSADTAGTDGWADTSYSGRFKLMTLRPAVVSGVRQVQVQVTGTSGSAATALGVRAKRKFV